MVVLDGHPGEDAVGRGIHAQTLQNNSLQIGAALEILVGQLSEVFDVRVDLRRQFREDLRVGDDVIERYLHAVGGGVSSGNVELPEIVDYLLDEVSTHLLLALHDVLVVEGLNQVSVGLRLYRLPPVVLLQLSHPFLHELSREIAEEGDVGVKLAVDAAQAETGESLAENDGQWAQELSQEQFEDLTDEVVDLHAVDPHLVHVELAPAKEQLYHDGGGNRSGQLQQVKLMVLLVAGCVDGLQELAGLALDDALYPGDELADVAKVEHFGYDSALVLPDRPISEGDPVPEGPPVPAHEELVLAVEALLVALEEGLHELRRDQVELHALGQVGDGDVELRGDLFDDTHHIAAPELRLHAHLDLSVPQRQDGVIVHLQAQLLELPLVEADELAGVEVEEIDTQKNQQSDRQSNQDQNHQILLVEKIFQENRLELDLFIMKQWFSQIMMQNQSIKFPLMDLQAFMSLISKLHSEALLEPMHEEVRKWKNFQIVSMMATPYQICLKYLWRICLIGPIFFLKMISNLQMFFLLLCYQAFKKWSQSIQIDLIKAQISWKTMIMTTMIPIIPHRKKTTTSIKQTSMRSRTKLARTGGIANIKMRQTKQPCKVSGRT